MTNEKNKQKKPKYQIQSWVKIFVPVILALIAIIVPLVTVFHNNPEKGLTSEDKDQFNTYSAQVSNLSDLFYKTNDEIELNKVDAELSVVAKAQAQIMQKYNLDFQAPWPPKYIPISSGKLQQTFLSNRYGLALAPAQAPSWNIILFVIIAIILIGIIILVVRLSRTHL